MAIIREKSYQLRVVEEATYGTDPSSGYQDIEAKNISVGKEYNPQVVEIGSQFENYDTLPGLMVGTISFDIPLQQADSNGTEFSLTTLMKGCAYGVASGETNQFDTINSPETNDSLYIQWYHDGILDVISGARGTMSIILTAGELAMCHFEFTGEYTQVADTAMPGSPSYDGQNIYAVGGNTMSYNTTDYHTSSIEYSDGNTIALIKSAAGTNGLYQVMVSDSEPTVTFDVLIEDTNASTFETAIENSTENTLLHERNSGGTADGKNPVLSLDTKIQNYSRESDDGIMRFSCEAVVTSFDLDLEVSA